MARTTPGSLSPYPQPMRPLRIVAAGTLFLTHTLALPAHPEPASSTRAHAYTRTRNGSACTVLAMLAQLRTRGIEKCLLVASLGGNPDGREVVRDLENAGVSTKYCKIWEGVGVPGAWILHAANTGTQTVINHNPLPDITHEEFVSLLGPLLAPENYPPPLIEQPSSGPPSPRPSLSIPAPAHPHLQAPIDPNAPPFDWLHFEGRSVRTTLHNIMGVDGLARERKWRSQCVFSLDVGRRAKQGVEALIPHADVLFLNKHYAQAHSPAYASTPRAFLLSLTALAPPHALLVAYWGAEGAAALSVPTREYFQSSGWAEDPPPSAASSAALSVAPPGVPGGVEGARPESKAEEIVSVRSGSDFWAAPGRTSSTLSAFSAALLSSGHGHSASGSGSGSGSGPGLIGSEQGHAAGNGNGNGNVGEEGRNVGRTGRGRGRGYMRGGRGEPLARQDEESDESDADSEGTEKAGSSDAGAAKGKGKTPSAEAVDEVGAQDAFVAGMIYALSRRLLPGAPYSPGLASMEKKEDDRRWRLDECLRFATELAGRKSRKRGWEGLADELARGGWFDAL